MALSLDDLKKKRPPRASLPNKTESNSVKPAVGVPVRKKLMPWDPIPSEEPRISEESLTEQTVSDNGASENPKPVEQNVGASVSSNEVVQEIQPTSTFTEPKGKIEGTPLTSEDTAIAKEELSVKEVSSEPFNLNAPELAVFNDNSTQDSGTIFSENGIPESSLLRSDTDLTQKEHRSDTNLDHDLQTVIKNNGKNQLYSKTEKAHRSDTNNVDTSKKQNIRSDTDLTHSSRPSAIKTHTIDRSDTDVTQSSAAINSANNQRSDTALTHSSDLVHAVLNQVKPKIGTPINFADKIRSDTEVTQSKKSKVIVSLPPEEVTQTKLKSDTEVTPYLTQKRHKEVTQSSAISEGDLVLRRILLLRGNGLNVFNFCCSTLLQIGQNVLQTSYEAISHQASVNIGSIKTTLKRLRDDNLLNIESHGGGKGALIDIIIVDSVLKVFARNLKNRSDTDLTHFTPQKRHRSDTNQDTNSSSMYVSNNKYTIHTENKPLPSVEVDIWSELREVDLSLLTQWNIRPTIIETFKKNNWQISRDEFENQIERFVRYFTEPEYQARRSSINSPYSFFLGCIKAIAKGEPNPIQDVKTQVELAQEAAVKNKLLEMERRRREYEVLEKQLDQYRESEFENWVAKLTTEEQAAILLPTKMAQVGSVAYRQLLKSYYTETIWPDFKQAILNGPGI